MILADKIIRLRKKNGWSQEELADKLNVSRQAVSKWEGAQTVPDLEKVLRLSELFGVTTDYLLKDDMEDEEFTQEDENPSVKKVTLAEANTFLKLREQASIKIAIATFICIMSVVPSFILGAISENPMNHMNEDLAGGLGFGIMFVLVAIASAIYIYCGFKNAPYEFLEKEPFDTEYGVKGMVKERQKAYRNTYAKFNIIGTCLCILSPVSIFFCALTEDDVVAAIAMAVMFALAGVGVIFFIIAGVRWASMEKLLKEGEYNPREKEKNKLTEAVSTIYWLVATAIYLGWSFATNDWGSSWIVWPVAGVLYAAVLAVLGLIKNEKNGENKENF